MKMQIFPFFVGMFFILLGLSIILKAFGIYIPFFRIAVAILIIAVGVKILMPGQLNKSNVSHTGRSTMFAESNIGGPEVSGDYSAVFGSSKIDLTSVNLKESVKVKVDAVFAGIEVKIDKKMPIKIVGNAVFGGVTMPNGNAAAFGTGTYESDSFNSEKPHLYIEANAVFGGVEIR